MAFLCTSFITLFKECIKKTPPYKNLKATGILTVPKIPIIDVRCCQREVHLPFPCWLDQETKLLGQVDKHLSSSYLHYFNFKLNFILVLSVILYQGQHNCLFFFVVCYPKIIYLFRAKWG